MTRDEMIAETRRLLQDLGLDNERSNERSAMVFLALAHLDEKTPWSRATDGRYRTREIMDWIRDHLGVDYTPNTRETVRRETLHQFCEGGVALYNDDQPDRPTNSPKACYRLTPSALDAVRSIGTLEYDTAVSQFREEGETWAELQAEAREMVRIPVHMPDGTDISLSGGGQNVLIKQMVEEFCPRFTPGGTVLYIDDTDKATGDITRELMRRLRVSIPDHGKAPDLIVFDETNGWLFMMEACSTHGPIDVVRKQELNRLFATVLAPMVYVSCFPDRATMRKYLVDLAWETEAWCADTPDHMIHLDGERFLGPYDD